MVDWVITDLKNVLVVPRLSKGSEYSLLIYNSGTPKQTVYMSWTNNLQRDQSSQTRYLSMLVPVCT